MRVCILAIALGAAMSTTLATPAMAIIYGFATAGPPPGSVVFRRPGPIPSLQHRYDLRMLALKDKMERLTIRDGGQLSLAHQASLQQELDATNRWFGLKPVHD